MSIPEPLNVAEIAWLPRVRASVVNAAFPWALTGTSAASVVAPSLNVTDPAETGLGPLVTVAVTVTSAPGRDGFGEDVTAVRVAGSASELMVRHQLPIRPESTSVSSTTNRLHTPLGLAPMKVSSVVALDAAGAGVGQTSSDPTLVGRNVPVNSRTSSGTEPLAVSENVRSALVGVPEPPPVSLIRTRFWPVRADEHDVEVARAGVADASEPDGDERGDGVSATDRDRRRVGRGDDAGRHERHGGRRGVAELLAVGMGGADFCRRRHPPAPSSVRRSPPPRSRAPRSRLGPSRGPRP